MDRSVYASVAQPVVQLIRNQQVVCSSHIASSRTKAPTTFVAGAFVCLRRECVCSRYPFPDWLLNAPSAARVCGCRAGRRTDADRG